MSAIKNALHVFETATGRLPTRDDLSGVAALVAVDHCAAHTLYDDRCHGCFDAQMEALETLKGLGFSARAVRAMQAAAMGLK